MAKTDGIAELSDSGNAMAGTGLTGRAQASRGALVAAFNGLVVSARYDDFGVGDIIRRADVSRSTFYQHFKSKDDLFRHSFAPVSSQLAAACAADCAPERLAPLLEHFRANRPLALGLLNGPSAPQVLGIIASHIQEKLTPGYLAGAAPSLAACQIAGSQLGLLRAWLAHEPAKPAGEVAVALLAGTRALVEALGVTSSARPPQPAG